MRIPQVTDRMKEAPTQVLRAVFGGIGQLLLIADRIRNREEDGEREQDLARDSAAKAKDPASKPAPAPAAPQESRWRSLDKTGNVRLLGADDPADGEADAEERERGPAPAAPEPEPEFQAAGPQLQPSPAEPEPEFQEAGPQLQPAPAEPEFQAAEPQLQPSPAEPDLKPEPETEPAAVPLAPLPWPNYDELSFASLRGRLRSLSQAQLRVLIEYERVNANRENVLEMFERRIAKLELSED
jgi:hypothetical protein